MPLAVVPFMGYAYAMSDTKDHTLIHTDNRFHLKVLKENENLKAKIFV